MDVESIRSFLTVASEGSYARAAPLLFRSVSALSRRIQELERELDVVLFERTSTGIRLSDGGHELVERAQSLVEAADALTADASQKNLPTGIRFGVSPGLGPSLLTSARRALSETGLDRVALVHGHNTQLIRKLINGQLDVALSHEKPQSTALSSRVVALQQVQILLGEGTPLAARSPLLLTDLTGHPFVTSPYLLAGAPIFYARLQSVLAEAGIEQIVKVKDIFWITEMVSNGPGFATWVQRYDEADDPRDVPPGVVVRSPLGLDLQLPTYLVHPSEAPWLSAPVIAALEHFLPTIADISAE